MGSSPLLHRDLAMVGQGWVPAAICARWGSVSLSSVHRAVDRGALSGTRVGRRLYVEWTAFRAFIGPLASQLPETATGAVEATPC